MTNLTDDNEWTSNSTFYDYIPIETNYCNMDETSRFSAIFTCILYFLIFFFSLLGNSLVLWIVMKYENLKSLTNLFILNLCITDLTFSCTLPFWIVYHYYGWIFGDFLCKAVSAIFSISYYGGIIFLTIMTILRYLAVVDPLSTMRTQNKKCSILVSMAIWSSSIMVAVPEIIFIEVIIDNHGKQHSCYIGMLKILLRSRSQRKYRTVRLIFAIVVVFFLSWAPYNVFNFVYVLSIQHVIKTECQTRNHIFFAFDISRKIAYCHCCINPILYVFVGVKFRRHLKLLYKQLSPCHGRISPSSPRMHLSHFGPHDDASIY
ncbi:chemokine XC receptor 1-like [Pantherophis guttatus]|uniref:Chemokine XC receptor 1 n=1 Tax=Pantherophis guttatus TaxID=94885 RepID=A0A6P9AVJ8_PANGU|nr:chemokine XC receptor 1 [Pantherophis guttatus]XP_060539615.1 chemokine XC receptor 1-like [Pantherophis guttatus]